MQTEAMDDALGSGDTVRLDSHKVADFDEQHQMETSVTAHLGLDPGKMKEMRMLMFRNGDLDENEDFRDQTSHHMTSLTKRNVRPSQKFSQRNSRQDTPPIVQKTPLALLEYNPGNDKGSSGSILMVQQNRNLVVRNSKMASFELDISHVAPLTDSHSRSVVDAALFTFMGRSFQAGRGTRGVLFHTGKPMCSSSSQIVLPSVIVNENIAIGKLVSDSKEKVQKELIDSEAPLSLHKEFDPQGEEEVWFGSFILELQRVVTDRVVLSDICRSYIGIIETELEVTGLFTSDKLFLMDQVMVWEFIEVLFSERQTNEHLNYAASDNVEGMMHDVNEDSGEINTEAPPLIRRAKFSCWLQKSASHRLQADLNGAGYPEHFLLTERELNSAVELATCKGDFRLACLLTQAIGSTVNRNDIVKQLHLWRRNGLDFNHIDKERIKLYELLVGNIHDALQDFTIDWTRFLRLLMRHHLPSDSSLPRIFRNYQLLLHQAKAPWHVPIYIDKGPGDGFVRNNKHSDLLYYLTLLIKNITNLTWGKELADQIAYTLKQSTESRGETFISFAPENGVSRFGLSDDEAEGIAMHDSPASKNPVGLDGDKIADLDEEHKTDTSESELSVQPFPEISRISGNLDSREKRKISLDGSSVLREYSEEISDSVPTLNTPDYFLKPCMKELIEREIENPGYFSRVPDLTIGRIGYGSIKFLGNTDVRRLDLDHIVKFQRHEVIVYSDESSKPVAGEGLNKAAEVTLIVDIPNLSWVKEQADDIAYKLKQSTERQGATFISFDPRNGFWKFLVPHFSRFGLSDDEAEDTDESEEFREISHLLPFLAKPNVTPSQKSSGVMPGKKQQQRLSFERRNLQFIADVVDAFEKSLKPRKQRKKRKRKCAGPQIDKVNNDPTNIWWDYENVEVPHDLPPEEVCGRFQKKFKEEGFTGRIKIKIVVPYNDSISPRVTSGLKKGFKEKLELIVVHKFNKPPNSKKNQIADTVIKGCIQDWLRKRRKPHNIMIVTGDKDFREALCSLLEAGHKTMIAFRAEGKDVSSAKISKFAKRKWNWRPFLSLKLNSVNKKTRDADFQKKKAAEFEKMTEAAAEFEKITEAAAKFEKMREAVETKKKKRPDITERLKNLVQVPHATPVNSSIGHVDDFNAHQQRLFQRVRAYGLLEVAVAGDGNCQFGAISDQLYGHSMYHKEVRRQILIQLNENRQWYEGFDGRDYNQYCKEMARDREWGDNTTLQAAADRFSVRIILLTSYRDNVFHVIEPRAEAGEPRSGLWLSFCAEWHYNSLYDNQAAPDQQKLKKRKRGN